MQKILIVEDDPKLANYLAKDIEKYGYAVRKVVHFSDVMKEFNQFSPRLVLLDINLPSFDGFYWCRQIRLVSTCPVIFISARTGEMDQVMSIENGGDDFITKPFHPEIVLAKIRSQIRRAYGEYAVKEQERIIELEGVQLFKERLELAYNGEVVTVSKNEAEIIGMLLERHPRVAGREALLEKIWDDKSFVDENTLNVNITRVRKKFQQIGVNDAIETVRGVGYRLHVTW